jgi:hypothetical protein
MYNNILIEYLFLINIIKSEVILNEKLFYNLKGISNEILINELNFCENEIIDFINYYNNFGNNTEYYKYFDLYFKNYKSEPSQILSNNLNFLFNNEIFVIKDISLLNKNIYNLDDLIEKKKNYKFNNNFIIKNLNSKYYLNFFKNNYFNITNTINFIFNIDLIQLIENKKSINIVYNLNLSNLNSYKNINKNLVNKINPLKYNNNLIYIKFYKNLNYFDYLNINNNNNLDLVKNHFILMTNLYTTEYNFKILLNFFKTNHYKEFYFKLPINYVSSNICNNLSKSYYSPTVDFYLNNLLYDKIIYNQNGNTINERFIFIKKKISSTPLFFNYKFKNKFNYFANKKYNLNINNIKNYNLDFFSISKTKKLIDTPLSLDYFYYGRGNIKSEISKASTLIQYNLPRIRPFVIRGNRRRQLFLDTTGTRQLIQNSDQININLRIKYNHYLYGFFKGGSDSLINFTEIDMFHNNCDIFFFKSNNLRKQHHQISILNKIAPVIKNNHKLYMDFFWEYDEKKQKNFFRNNLLYLKTKYERALNLMFNFNEELKPNNTIKEYFNNILFGFVKDNNKTYITFKDHYNKNNFISKHILYRINNNNYHKNKKYNIFYKEFLDSTHKKTWEEPFYFDKIKKLPFYLHTKNNYIYPNYKVWPISENYKLKYFIKRGYIRNYRQVMHFYRFISNDNLIPYSRFLKTGRLSQSIYNKYYNFIPFLHHINNFDFIKKSNDYTKRKDFISFIPKFKIFGFKIFNSIENFKYFDNTNAALIKFNDTLYNNNNQKLDQSLYNLNIFNNKIINYIPDVFYEKYATLEWNNNLFFKILNRKLFYKHLISFGDLSNIFIQNYIYNYAKTVFFEEKLKNTFFNRNIFKYKNFENLNDFIKYKANNIYLKNKNLIINKNKNFNILKDYKNIINILINPYLHIKKHYNLFYIRHNASEVISYFNSDYKYYRPLVYEPYIIYNHNILKSLTKYKNTKNFIKIVADYEDNKIFNFEEDYDKWCLDNKKFFGKVIKNKPKFFDIDKLIYVNTFNNYMHESFPSESVLNYLMKYSYNIENRYKTSKKELKALEVKDFFYLKDRSFIENYFYFQYIRHPLKQIYLFLKLHIAYSPIYPRPFERSENLKPSYSHITNYRFFTYQIPKNYINYLIKNKIYNLKIFDTIFSFLLIFNLNLLSNIQKIDNIYNLDNNYNFLKFFKNEIKINNINLVKKKTLTNYKLYKNNLIEEAGLYNVNIINNNNNIKDEDLFLLYNRKRLDNESIYKSWHSTKFLNKKINYYSNSSVFNLEKNFEFFYNSYIFNILRFKNFNMLYKLNYLTTSFLNYFSTDVDFNRIVFHTIGSSSYARNLNFAYPQNNIKNIQVFSFISYLKEKIGYSLKDRYLNGTFKRHYLSKQLDIENEFYEYKSNKRQVGVYLYGFKKRVFFMKAYSRYIRRYEFFEEDSVFFKINKFKTNIMNLKHLTRKEQKHNIYRYLSYFQYYGDTRYPKKKNNFKKLNFIFNIYNFNSYFINDRYSFENKNLLSIQQFYNHRTTSDYLRNLINYKKKEMSNDYFFENDKYNINDIKMVTPYYKLYNLYMPIKIWELKLSTKLFPYFYSKNLSLNYKIVQNIRLEKIHNNIYMKRSNMRFRKKNKFYLLEYFRYFMFEISSNKFLKFENNNNSFIYFYNNFRKNTKYESQIKKKYFLTSIGNLINIEYNNNLYNNKKEYIFSNKAFMNIFNFKLNNDLKSFSYIYKINNKLPNHFNYKIFFDLYTYDKSIFINKSLKVFNYCIKNNFYVKLPYITESYLKNFYDYFSDNKSKFFKLRTLKYYGFWDSYYRRADIIEDFFFKRPYFKEKPYCPSMIDKYDIHNSFMNYKNNTLNFSDIALRNKFIFNFYDLKFKSNLIFFKFIYKQNLDHNIYYNIYSGNIKYYNYSFFNFLKKKNDYFFFSKIFEFNKYVMIQKNNKYFFSFFNPYDFYIFRYKSSFTSLNKVFYKNNSNSNLRSFIYNLFNIKEYKNKNSDFFNNLLDKNFWFIFDREIFRYQQMKPIYYSNINKFTHYFKKNSFNLKYYEQISSYNKKKIEDLSLFGFLIKNNILFGIFEYNNLYNLSYNLKYENFHIHNNESNVYSINKLLNTIFVLKNKYIWLIFFYYNNFFYFLFNAKNVLEDFLWEPVNFWSYYFYFKVPILFSLNYKLFILDVSLTIYTIFIQILIIFYSWFCVSGEGLINFKDYIILNNNEINWDLLYDKYNIYPCDLYGRSLFEMQISRIIFIFFVIGYSIIYIKLLFILSYILYKTYNLLLLNLNRKKRYFFINNKFDLEINNKIHYYYLNYEKFIKSFNNLNNNFEIIFFFKSKHSYKYYKSKFKCKFKLPYFLDESSLRRINKMKILSNFETHNYILDIDLKKFRTTLSFLNSSYALFTKTRTIEIGNLLIKGNIKRILYIHQLGNFLAYDPVLANSLMPESMNNLEKKDFYFIDRIFLNNQLKIFTLMPISEDINYIYIPKFIFKNLIKYRFKYINVYYTYNFLFFITFDSLLTIEGTLFRISNPNFFKPLIFFNQNITPRSFSFFI